MSALQMYTVYQNPRDYPGKFVVRRALISDGGVVMDPQPLVVADDVHDCRRVLVRAGLVCMRRTQGDDPCIVEVWL